MSELLKEHRIVSTEAVVRVGEGRDYEFVDDDTVAALKARLAKAAASGWGLGLTTRRHSSGEVDWSGSCSPRSLAYT
jgi:transposase